MPNVVMILAMVLAGEAGPVDEAVPNRNRHGGPRESAI